MTAQKKAGKNAKSEEETRTLSHFSKSEIRYWSECVFRKGYTRDGHRRYTKEWYARMQHAGQRDFFPLQTSNKAAASTKARDIYIFLAANGWEATLARHKKTKTVISSQNSEKQCTVGEHLLAVCRQALRLTLTCLLAMLLHGR